MRYINTIDIDTRDSLSKDKLARIWMLSVINRQRSLVHC